MKPTPETEKNWPTRDSEADTRGLPGYPKEGPAGGRPDTGKKPERKIEEQSAEDDNLGAD